MNFLHLLYNKQIQGISSSVGEFYDLGSEPPSFVPEIVLQIEDYSLTISNPIQLGPTCKSLEDLIGQRICEIEEDSAFIKITMVSGDWMEIDLREEAWEGPEAMVMWGPNNLCVVWNEIE